MQALTKEDFHKKWLIHLYKNSGLTILRDDVYVFALELEEMCMTLLNMTLLKNF